MKSKGKNCLERENRTLRDKVEVSLNRIDITKKYTIKKCPF